MSFPPSSFAGLDPPNITSDKSIKNIKINAPLDAIPCISRDPKTASHIKIIIKINTGI